MPKYSIHENARGEVEINEVKDYTFGPISRGNDLFDKIVMTMFFFLLLIVIPSSTMKSFDGAQNKDISDQVVILLLIVCLIAILACLCFLVVRSKDKYNWHSHLLREYLSSFSADFAGCTFVIFQIFYVVLLLINGDITIGDIFYFGHTFYFGKFLMCIFGQLLIFGGLYFVSHILCFPIVCVLYAREKE